MSILYTLIAKIFGEWLRQWWFVRAIKGAERARIRREIEKIRERKRDELSGTDVSPVEDQKKLADRADRLTGGRYDIYD